MISKNILTILLLLFIGLTISAQDAPKKLFLDGYVKNLQSLYFLDGINLQDNLFHHRLNAEWVVGEKWTIHGGLRTRLFYGDFVKITPEYVQDIDAGSNDWIDMSVIWMDKNNFAGQSVLDRFYAEYVNDKWEIRAGRQRVNWGISTIWNPNDIFNAYSFTDFDYEERPGADALRVRRYLGYTGSLEVAVQGADHIKESTIASRWVFNAESYDIQVIGGYAKDQWVLGSGWAGNLKDAGFKGELSSFYDAESDSLSFAVTMNVDYAFESSLYLNGGFLFNSNGSTDANASDLFSFDLSASNLYPYQWATFLQGAFTISPLVNTGVAIIYSPVKSKALFINPTVAVSIANNWTIDAVGQLVFNESNGKYSSPLQAAFLRLKFNY